MSQPVSRVIGIIRISEPRAIGARWNAGSDDSTLGALLAGLVGKRPPRASAGSRWEPEAPARFCGRRAIPANLAALREDLEREYVALTAG
jgi:hypothetical protein